MSGFRISIYRSDKLYVYHRFLNRRYLLQRRQFQSLIDTAYIQGDAVEISDQIFSSSIIKLVFCRVKRIIENDLNVFNGTAVHQRLNNGILNELIWNRIVSVSSDERTAVKPGIKLSSIEKTKYKPYGFWQLP